MTHDTTGSARRRKPDSAKIKIKGSWTAIPNKLLKDHRLSRDARLLGCLMFMHAGNSGTTFPSQEELADELSFTAKVVTTDPDTNAKQVGYEERAITVRSIQRWLIELREAGWITWRHTLRNNAYTLIDPTESGAESPPHENDDTSDSSDLEAAPNTTPVSPNTTEGSHAHATERSPNTTAVSCSNTIQRSPNTTAVSPNTTAVSPHTTQVSPSTILESDSYIDSIDTDSSSSDLLVGDDVPTPTELFLQEENLGVAHELRDMPLDLARQYVADARQRGASLPAIAKGLRARWKREQARRQRAREDAAPRPPDWIDASTWPTLPAELQIALDDSSIDEGYLCYYERHEAIITLYAEEINALLDQARREHTVEAGAG